jgi:hypothetical protein
MPGEDEGGRFGGGEPTDLPTELKKWADAIKATTEAYDAVSNLLSAARSVVLEVNNTTSQLLRFQFSKHDWGTFRQPPHGDIPPGVTDLFSSESDRPLTGTQGHVRYSAGDDEGTTFHLEWNVPFIGGNESDCRVEVTPNPSWYIAKAITPGGGNTQVHMRYMIGEVARANKLSSQDWRTCTKCKLLFFGLDDGHCAARPLGITSGPSEDMLRRTQAPLPGGLQQGPRRGVVAPQSPLPGGVQQGPLGGVTQPSPPVDPATAGMELFGNHEAAGYYFRLPYGVAGPHRMADWCKCIHCKGLFNNGEETKGVCPGRRGGHVAEAEGQRFQLVYGVPPGPSQQDNWRFCDKCYGMFFLPQNADAVCPAGGNHHARSDSYVLDYQG